MLRALTLLRPWTDAILYGGKRVENRTWAPPKSIIGTVIALHAGRGYQNLEDSYWPSGGWQPPSKKDSAEGIVGLARVVRVIGSDPLFADRRPEGLPEDQIGWWCGPIGWLLADVQPLKRPVPCVGHLSVWLVPDAVELAVREQIAA